MKGMKLDSEEITLRMGTAPVALPQDKQIAGPPKSPIDPTVSENQVQWICNFFEKVQRSVQVDHLTLHRLFRTLQSWSQSPAMNELLDSGFVATLATLYDSLLQKDFGKSDVLTSVLNLLYLIEDMTEAPKGKDLCGKYFVSRLLVIAPAKMMPVRLQRAAVETLCALITKSPANQQAVLDNLSDCSKLFKVFLPKCGDFQLQASITEIFYRLSRREPQVLNLIEDEVVKGTLSSLHQMKTPDLLSEIRNLVVMLNKSLGPLRSVYSFLSEGVIINGRSVASAEEKWVDFGKTHFSFYAVSTSDKEKDDTDARMVDILYDDTDARMVDILYVNIINIRKSSDLHLEIDVQEKRRQLLSLQDESSLSRQLHIQLSFAAEDLSAIVAHIIPKIRPYEVGVEQLSHSRWTGCSSHSGRTVYRTSQGLPIPLKTKKSRLETSSVVDLHHPIPGDLKLETVLRKQAHQNITTDGKETVAGTIRVDKGSLDTQLRSAPVAEFVTKQVLTVTDSGHDAVIPRVCPVTIFRKPADRPKLPMHERNPLDDRQTELQQTQQQDEVLVHLPDIAGIKQRHAEWQSSATPHCGSERLKLRNMTTKTLADPVGMQGLVAPKSRSICPVGMNEQVPSAFELQLNSGYGLRKPNDGDPFIEMQSGFLENQQVEIAVHLPDRDGVKQKAAVPEHDTPEKDGAARHTKSSLAEPAAVKVPVVQESGHNLHIASASGSEVSKQSGAVVGVMREEAAIMPEGLQRKQQHKVGCKMHPATILEVQPRTGYGREKPTEGDPLMKVQSGVLLNQQAEMTVDLSGYNGAKQKEQEVAEQDILDDDDEMMLLLEKAEAGQQAKMPLSEPTAVKGTATGKEGRKSHIANEGPVASCSKVPKQPDAVVSDMPENINSMGGGLQQIHQVNRECKMHAASGGPVTSAFRGPKQPDPVFTDKKDVFHFMSKEGPVAKVLSCHQQKQQAERARKLHVASGGLGLVTSASMVLHESNAVVAYKPDGFDFMPEEGPVGKVQSDLGQEQEVEFVVHLTDKLSMEDNVETLFQDPAQEAFTTCGRGKGKEKPYEVHDCGAKCGQLSTTRYSRKQRLKRIICDPVEMDHQQADSGPHIQGKFAQRQVTPNVTDLAEGQQTAAPQAEDHKKKRPKFTLVSDPIETDRGQTPSPSMGASVLGKRASRKPQAKTHKLAGARKLQDMTITTRQSQSVASKVNVLSHRLKTKRDLGVLGSSSERVFCSMDPEDGHTFESCLGRAKQVRKVNMPCCPPSPRDLVHFTGVKDQLNTINLLINSQISGEDEDILYEENLAQVRKNKRIDDEEDSQDKSVHGDSDSLSSGRRQFDIHKPRGIARKPPQASTVQRWRSSKMSQLKSTNSPDSGDGIAAVAIDLPTLHGIKPKLVEVESEDDSGVGRAATVVVSLLDRFKKKVELQSERKMAQILSVTLGKVELEAEAFTTEVKKELDNFTKDCKRKFGFLENQLQDRKRKFQVMQKKVEKEFNEHLQQYNQVCSQLKDTEMDLKRIAGKQRMEQKKLFAQLQGSSECHLADADRKLFDMKKAAKRMYGLRDVLEGVDWDVD